MSFLLFSLNIPSHNKDYHYAPFLSQWKALLRRGKPPRRNRNPSFRRDIQDHGIDVSDSALLPKRGRLTPKGNDSPPLWKALLHGGKPRKKRKRNRGFRRYLRDRGVDVPPVVQGGRDPALPHKPKHNQRKPGKKQSKENELQLALLPPPATRSRTESPIVVSSSSPLPSPSHSLLLMLAAKVSWKPEAEADSKNFGNLWTLWVYSTS
ncbi:hypothetical protein N7536_003629 [Penicillium majusculum]|nr:hypothetical protein N7536_003629 [Penicillium majusculum]